MKLLVAARRRRERARRSASRRRRRGWARWPWWPRRRWTRRRRPVVARRSRGARRRRVRAARRWWWRRRTRWSRSFRSIRASTRPRRPRRSGWACIAIHAAAGVGYGNGFAGNSHRHAPDGWMPAMKYMVEVLHADVNARDQQGMTPLHHAAARGDNEMIQYLVAHGADVKAVSRNGRTTSTWPTARCSVCVRSPKRSRCSRSSARSTSTTACPASHPERSEGSTVLAAWPATRYSTVGPSSLSLLRMTTWSC